jgi:hypothetical protein
MRYHPMIMLLDGRTACLGLPVLAALVGGAGSALGQSTLVIARGSDEFQQSIVPAKLGSVVSVAAGYGHSVALRADGTVWCWGATEFNFGQCTPPEGLASVKQVDGADLSVLLAGWGLCPNAVGNEPETAIELAPGDSAAFSTRFKTPSPGTPEDGACRFLGWTAATRDAWFSVASGSGGTMSISLCASKYDTSMVVYSRGPEGTLTRIACDDDTCEPDGPGYQSRIDGLQVTGTVLIRIGGFGGTAGDGRPPRARTSHAGLATPYRRQNFA